MSRRYTNFKPRRTDPIEKLPWEFWPAIQVRNSVMWALFGPPSETRAEPKFSFRTARLGDLSLEIRLPTAAQLQWFTQNPYAFDNLPFCLTISVGDDHVFCLEWDNFDRLNLLRYDRGDWETALHLSP